jgi:hypothetical protein
MEIELHQRENSEDTESFLQENMGKIRNHSNRVVELLYSGKKYTAKEVNDTLNMAEGGRRLREILVSRKDCKKQWRLDSNGKRLAVEYWLEITGIPTKNEVIEKAEAVINAMKKVAPKKKMVKVFNLPDENNDHVIQQPFL